MNISFFIPKKYSEMDEAQKERMRESNRRYKAKVKRKKAALKPQLPAVEIPTKAPKMDEKQKARIAAWRAANPDRVREIARKASARFRAKQDWTRAEIPKAWKVGSGAAI